MKIPRLIHHGVDLHQPAVVADHGAQREGRLGRARLLRRDDRYWRRGWRPRSQKVMAEPAAAGAAGGDGARTAHAGTQPVDRRQAWAWASSPLRQAAYQRAVSPIASGVERSGRQPSAAAARLESRPRRGASDMTGPASCRQSTGAPQGRDQVAHPDLAIRRAEIQRRRRLRPSPAARPASGSRAARPARAATAASHRGGAAPAARPPGRRGPGRGPAAARRNRRRR